MNKQKKAEIVLIIITILWASTFAIIKNFIIFISPMLLISSRFLISTGLSISFNWKEIKTISKKVIINGTVLGFLLFVGFVIQTYGLKYTTASKSAFVTGLMVVFAPMFQLIIEKKMPRKGNILSIIIVTAGLFLLTSPDGSEINIGDIITLFSAIVYGIYIVLLDVYTKEDSAGITFVQFATTGLFALIGMIFFENFVFEPSIGLIIAVCFLAIFATYINIYLMTKFQRDSTPTRAAIIYSLEPVFASVIAILAIGEIMKPIGILGGALIIFGVIFTEVSDKIFPNSSKIIS